MVGMITSVGGMVGGDGAAHMAEELRDASKSLPRVMLGTIFLNGSMGLIMLMYVSSTLNCLKLEWLALTAFSL